MIEKGRLHGRRAHFSPRALTGLFALAIALTAMAHPADAALKFDVEDANEGTTGMLDSLTPGGSTPDFAVVPGGSVTIDLFLVETFNSTGGETSILEEDNGLVSAQFEIVRTANNVAGTLSNADVAKNPAFDEATRPGGGDPGQHDSAGGGTMDEALNVFVDPPPATGVGPGTFYSDRRCIFLGRITLHTALTAGQTTSFNVQDDPDFEGIATFGPSGGGGFLGQFLDDEDLTDPIAAQGFTVTTTGTVIPEPTTLGLLLVAGGLGHLGSRRGRSRRG